MKQVLFLGRRDFGEKNNVVDIATQLKAATTTELQFEHAFFDELVFYVDTHQSKIILHKDTSIDIADFDLVVLLGWTGNRVLGDMAYAIGLYLASKNREFWNSELAHARSMTKLSQLFKVSQLGMKIAKSVFSLNHELMRTVIPEYLQSEKLVCKDIQASRGRRNVLATSSSLQETLQMHQTHPMIVQEYIENDGSDLRFVMLGEGTPLVIKRQSQSQSHLTNISAGGQALLIDPQSVPEPIEEAAKIARAFDREICGIDYMYDTAKKHYVFLEINMTPQLTNGAFSSDKINRLYSNINDRLSKR